MGGCCCCSSKGVGLNRSPTYYHYPRVSAEREPLSSHHGMVSALSTGLLVDVNLETSIPDTYRPPPAPLPYDTNLRHPLTPITESAEETNAGNTLASSHHDLKESDCKIQKGSDLASLDDVEVDFEKSVEKKSNEPLASALEEEDVCPTCLEEYDTENPKIITKCEHHFHLACILEWKERSNTCPVCDQEMIFSPTVDG